MSIVTAVRHGGRITMAADTLALFGDGMVIPQPNAIASKIMKVGDALIGGTGWAVYDDIIDHWIADTPPVLDSRRAIYAFFLDFWKALRENYSLVNEQAATKETPFGDLDATFLIACSGGLFQVSSDLGVTRFTSHHAIGSGAEYALGAMHALINRDGMSPEHIARAGCEAAIDLDASCGGRIDVHHVACLES